MEKPNKLVMVVFMLMPLFTSLISISHVTVFLSVSNSSNMAIILSIAYETGMLVALSCMFFLHRLEKATVYFIFVLLFILQLIGNIYYSFYYITEQLKTNKQYLDTVTEFIVQIANLFDSKPSVSNIKMIIAIIIGFIVPVVSMSFLRLLTKYIKSFEKPNIEEDNKTEDKKSPIINWAAPNLSGLIKKYKEKNNSTKEETQITNEEKTKSSESDIEIKIEERDDLEKQKAVVEVMNEWAKLNVEHRNKTSELVDIEKNHESVNIKTEVDDNVSESETIKEVVDEDLILSVKFDPEVIISPPLESQSETQPTEPINIALEKSQSVVDKSLLKINDNILSTNIFHPLR